MKLKGKVALITGASKGIGRAAAKGYAQEGAELCLAAHVDKAGLDQTIEICRSFGIRAEGGLFNVSSYASVKAMADKIEESFGALDILVNNAGIIRPTPLLEITPEQWDITVATHLNGTFYCTIGMVNRFMKGKRSGKIITQVSHPCSGVTCWKAVAMASRYSRNSGPRLRNWARVSRHRRRTVEK